MCFIRIFVHSLKSFAYMKLFAEILALLGHFPDRHRLAQGPLCTASMGDWRGHTFHNCANVKYYTYQIFKIVYLCKNNIY